MSVSNQETPSGSQLWAGEIKLTVHVPKELEPSEAQELAKSLDDIAKRLKAFAEDTLPPGCRVGVQLG